MPILQSLHDRFLQTRTQAANGGLRQSHRLHLEALSKPNPYANSGHLPLDNNPVENTIRPIALGKKNRLFTGSERTGKRAAAIQTLLDTSKFDNLTPSNG